MDGASKFVRGDAIAGLLITFINIIAGMIIGIAHAGA
jgi:flagellar biosynthesis protein FlhA